jgi:hypothetical protein
MIPNHEMPSDSILALQHSQKPHISPEMKRIQQRIDGFDWERSPAWLYLCWRFGPRLSQEELISIGTLVAATLQIKLDRDARRRKVVMVKWFEEHWAEIQPLLCLIVLDKSENKV